MERKEAIEVIKKNWPDSSFIRLREALKTVIPELKESEDERIMKEISTYLKSVVANKGYGDSIIESWIAWLEKQGEHARFRRAIQVGDQVTKNDDGVLVNLSQLKRVAKPRQKPADKEERVEEYGTKSNIKDK